MLSITLKSGKIVKASAIRGNKPATWNPSGNHYHVTLRINRKSHTFDFWDSFHNHQEGIPCDIRGAVACFASDVMLFRCEEIEDVTDGLKAKEIIRIYKACEKASQVADRLGLTDDELNELQDY